LCARPNATSRSRSRGHKPPTRDLTGYVEFWRYGPLEPRSGRRGAAVASTAARQRSDVVGNRQRKCDLAALNKIEMLPWDSWGAMRRSAWSPTREWLTLFDRVASLTRAPDDYLATCANAMPKIPCASRR